MKRLLFFTALYLGLSAISAHAQIHGSVGDTLTFAGRVKDIKKFWYGDQTPDGVRHVSFRIEDIYSRSEYGVAQVVFFKEGQYDFLGQNFIITRYHDPEVVVYWGERTINLEWKHTEPGDLLMGIWEQQGVGRVLDSRDQLNCQDGSMQKYLPNESGDYFYHAELWRGEHLIAETYPISVHIPSWLERTTRPLHIPRDLSSRSVWLGYQGSAGPAIGFGNHHWLRRNMPIGGSSYMHRVAASTACINVLEFSWHVDRGTAYLGWNRAKSRAEFNLLAVLNHKPIGFGIVFRAAERPIPYRMYREWFVEPSIYDEVFRITASYGNGLTDLGMGPAIGVQFGELTIKGEFVATESRIQMDNIAPGEELEDPYDVYKRRYLALNINTSFRWRIGPALHSLEINSGEPWGTPEAVGDEIPIAPIGWDAEYKFRIGRIEGNIFARKFGDEIRVTGDYLS